jgi:hypothetical protein
MSFSSEVACASPLAKATLTVVCPLVGQQTSSPLPSGGYRPDDLLCGHFLAALHVCPLASLSCFLTFEQFASADVSMPVTVRKPTTGSAAELFVDVAYLVLY